MYKNGRYFKCGLSQWEACNGDMNSMYYSTKVPSFVRIEVKLREHCLSCIFSKKFSFYFKLSSHNDCLLTRWFTSMELYTKGYNIIRCSLLWKKIGLFYRNKVEAWGVSFVLSDLMRYLKSLDASPIFTYITYGNHSTYTQSNTKKNLMRWFI